MSPKVNISVGRYFPLFIYIVKIDDKKTGIGNPYIIMTGKTENINPRLCRILLS